MSKRFLFLILLAGTLLSCEQLEPEVPEVDLTGKIFCGFDDYTSPLPGSMTVYYIGYKFNSKTSATEFKASYSPPVKLLDKVILEETFDITKTEISYSMINKNEINLGRYSGDITTKSYITITKYSSKIFLFDMTKADDRAEQLILESLQ